MTKNDRQKYFVPYSPLHFVAMFLLALFMMPCPANAANLFEPFQAYQIDSWPEAVAIGDINNDGRNDVVLTTGYYFSSYDFKLFVFYQDINGGLQEPVILSLIETSAGNPLSVDIGDMNNDGLQDVVVGNDENLQVFLQNSSGELDQPVLYQTNHSMKIRIGDLNGDQKQDIAGIEWGGNDAAVILQNESGALDSELFYSALHGGYDDLELGDVNSDGLLDIVVMSGQSYSIDNLAILTQNSSGGFDPVSMYDLGGDELTSGVTVGDLNGDGRKDVAVTFGGNRPYSHIGVFLQDDAGQLKSAVLYPSYDIPESIQAADVNGDGREDLVVLHGGWNRMGVYLQQGDGTLSTEVLYPIPYASHYNPHGLAVDDINGDSEPDVVIADYNSGLVVLYHTASNTPPIADAGSDQTVVQKSVVLLDGTGSYDQDGEIVRYSWQQVAGIPVTLVQETNPAVVSFVAPAFQGKEVPVLEFQLTVTDNGGRVASDSQVVTVVRKLNK